MSWRLGRRLLPLRPHRRHTRRLKGPEQVRPRGGDVRAVLVVDEFDREAHGPSSASRLSKIGQWLTRPRPAQAAVSRTSAFFMPSSMRTLASISPSFASARFCTSPQELRGSTRRARSVLISLSEKPSPCARLIKRTRRTASEEKTRYPEGVRGGLCKSPRRS